MQVIVFDLDTALCLISTMDGLAMASAIEDVAGCQIAPETVKSLQDWKSIWYSAIKRVATKRELSELRARFSHHLRRQLLIRPAVVQGNYALIQHANRMHSRKDTVVCLVSTSTRSVVEAKARAIGLISDQLPIVTGEDAESAEAMLTLLQTRVKRMFGELLEGADMVASGYWSKAAQLLEMQHHIPEAYEQFVVTGACQPDSDRSSKLFRLF